MTRRYGASAMPQPHLATLWASPATKLTSNSLERFPPIAYLSATASLAGSSNGLGGNMNFKRTLALGALAGLMSQPAWSAQPAEGATEEAALSQCVALKTTGADRLLTARWLLAMMTKSPQIGEFSTVDADRTKELNRDFANLFTRIITKDCAAEMRPVAAVSVVDAFGQVGKDLGEIAMNELMSDKAVDKAMGEYAAFLSEDDFKPFLDSLPKKSQ
jgi:hypothetical protein